MPAAEAPTMPSHKSKLYYNYPDQDLHRDMTYERSTGWQVGCCMSSGVEMRN
jgi:hypothetical protein